jgi:hypothetical protein
LQRSPRSASRHGADGGHGFTDRTIAQELDVGAPRCVAAARYVNRSGGLRKTFAAGARVMQRAAVIELTTQTQPGSSHPLEHTMAKEVGASAIRISYLARHGLKPHLSATPAPMTSWFEEKFTDIVVT